MNAPTPLATLIDLLRGEPAGRGILPGEWTDLIAAARAANLLGSLGERMAAAQAGTGCNADRHLEGARQLSERQRRSVRWEAQCINDALARLGVPIVLLKGAAYVLGDYANARGRLFGDIDILVPSASLGAAEVALMVAGWTPIASATEYDQRYYRTWMHELPPMVHPRRGSVIDVHHTILPPTARLKPDPAGLIARSRPVPGLDALRVPCVEDLVIHSITHLVHEGELHNGLRDLYDIHTLVTVAAQDRGFWTRLLDCTREHGLGEPVALGLRLVRRHFGTAIPDAAAQALGFDEKRFAARRLIALYGRALVPPALRDAPRTGAGADLALYVRAHWLRMPPLLLARHLVRKAAFRAGFGPPETAPREP